MWLLMEQMILSNIHMDNRIHSKSQEVVREMKHLLIKLNNNLQPS